MEEHKGKKTLPPLAAFREIRSESEKLRRKEILSDQKIADLKLKIESSDRDLIDVSTEILCREKRLRELVRLL